MATLVLVVLDGAIANVALPTLAATLQVPAATSVWVVNGYQLALVMTYGVAVLTASGLFTAISGLGEFLPGSTPEISTAYVALVLNGLAYLLTATTVWFRIREISGRAVQRRAAAPGLLALLRDGFRFVASTPLVRGLVIGIIGAFTAGGIVGRVTRVEDAHVEVEIAPNTRVRVVKATLTDIVGPNAKPAND